MTTNNLQNQSVANYNNRDKLFNNSINDEKLLTKNELAIFLNVSKKTIDKKVSLKEIPFIKIGRLVRFDKKEVQAWLNGKSH